MGEKEIPKHVREAIETQRRKGGRGELDRENYIEKVVGLVEKESLKEITTASDFYYQGLTEENQKIISNMPRFFHDIYLFLKKNMPENLVQEGATTIISFSYHKKIYILFATPLQERRAYTIREATEVSYRYFPYELFVQEESYQIRKQEKDQKRNLKRIPGLQKALETAVTELRSAGLSPKEIRAIVSNTLKSLQ